MLYILAQAGAAAPRGGSGARRRRSRIVRRGPRKTRSSGRRNKCQGNTSLPRQKAGVTNNSQQKATNAKRERKRKRGGGEKGERQGATGQPGRDSQLTRLFSHVKTQRIRTTCWLYLMPKSQLISSQKKYKFFICLQREKLTKKSHKLKADEFQLKKWLQLHKKTAELSPRKVCFTKPNGNDALMQMEAKAERKIQQNSRQRLNFQTKVSHKAKWR